jgi:hypothetical protein
VKARRESYVRQRGLVGRQVLRWPRTSTEHPKDREYASMRLFTSYLVRFSTLCSAISPLDVI